MAGCFQRGVKKQRRGCSFSLYLVVVAVVVVVVFVVVYVWFVLSVVVVRGGKVR